MYHGRERAEEVVNDNVWGGRVRLKELCKGIRSFLTLPPPVTSSNLRLSSKDLLLHVTSPPGTSSVCLSVVGMR